MKGWLWLAGGLPAADAAGATTDGGGDRRFSGDLRAGHFENTRGSRTDARSTAGAAASWVVSESGIRLVPGVELGYAPNRPLRQVVDSEESGKARGLAWQTAISHYDLAPGHNLSVVYARIGGGWLLSGDFRGNDELAEIRYQ